MMQVVDCAVGGDGNYGENLLENLDSYLEDIDIRLIVSRMVSGAIIRGVVAAIQEEAAGEIFASNVAATEAVVELARLKKTVPEFHVFEAAAFGIKDGTVGNSVQQQNATSNGSISTCQVSPSNWMQRRQMDVDDVEEGKVENSVKPQNEASNGYMCTCQVSLSDWKQRWQAGLDMKEGRDEKSVKQQEAVSNGDISKCQVALSDGKRRLEIEEKENGFTEWSSVISQVSEMREELDLIVQSLSLPGHGSSVSSNGGTTEGRYGQGWDPVPKTEGLNPGTLNGMTKEELLKYINEEVSEMRRSYESHLHRLTDDYFFQKRTSGGRGPALLRNKDRVLLDLSRQKISQLLSKLDAFLFEHANSPTRADVLESARFENSLLSAEMKEREEEMGEENRLFGAVAADVYGLVIQGAVSEVEESVLGDLLRVEAESVMARGTAEVLARDLQAEKEVRAYLEKRVFEGEMELKWMKEEMEEQEARFGGAVGELWGLREQVREQEGVVARGVREVVRVKAEQEEMVQKIVEACEQQVRGVNEKLEASARNLRESREKRGVLSAALGDMRAEMEAVRAEDAENRLRLLAVVEGSGLLLREISSFEMWVVETLGKSALRLNISEQELRIQADKLRKKSLLLNKSLLVKRTEHMMAESKVVHLSEEVVSLSSLLHKIYRALDHYSPILHHYPGVTEILELIRREIEKGYSKDKPLIPIVPL